MVTLTLTQGTVARRARLVKRPQLVQRRKRHLRRSGHSYTDLARVAQVTHSMAWKWMNGERQSDACRKAFDLLTARTA